MPMLAEVFDKIRPTIVAFGSRVVVTAPGRQPQFPEIIGTGFIVDSRGIVVTNAHVIEALTKLQKHPTRPESPALAILTTEVEHKDGMHHLGTLFTSIVGYNLIQSFVPEGPFYELALLSLDLCEEAIQITEVRHVSLYAGYISSDL